MALPALLPAPPAAAGSGGRNGSCTIVSVGGFKPCADGEEVEATCVSEMWRAAARHLSRSNSKSHRRFQELHQGQQKHQHLEPTRSFWPGNQFASCRGKSSAAASALRGSVDGGWNSACRFGPASSPEHGPHRLSSLEESVFALDAALHDAVNLPWIATQILPHAVSDELSLATGGHGDHFRLSHRFNAVAGFAGAAEKLEEPEEVHEEFEELQRDKQALSQKEERRGAKKKYSALYARQKKRETEAWTGAVADYKDMINDMCKKSLAPTLPVVQSLLLGWFEPLRKAIEAEQKECRDQVQSKLRSVYGRFLLQLPADVLAVITMHKVTGMCLEQHNVSYQSHLHGAVRVVNVTLQIGEAVESEVGIRNVLAKGNKRRFEKAEKAKLDEAKRVEEVTRARRVKKLVSLRKLRRVDEILKEADVAESWGDEIRAKVGAKLLQLFLETAVVRAPAENSGDDGPEIRPAFKHTTRIFPTRKHKMSRSFGVVEMDNHVYNALAKASGYPFVMPYMPMIVPPNAWTSHATGGYLTLKGSLMRTHGSRDQFEAIKGVPREAAPLVYKALDTLGQTAWKINKDILDVVEHLWKNGGRLGNLVDQDDVVISARPDEADEEELKVWKKEYMIAKRINSERHAMRCDINLKLQVAREMAEEEGFYYPHNVDFRGRAYPMHPHLNHLGSDMCRGILEFAKGRPLAQTGLRWLKISLASLYGGGFDKLPLDSRVAFADDNMDKVFDSAERPLDGEQWWASAEDPFQCLAVCMDLRNALKSGNPSEYISHVPVHQDGSCNGLQHYAALGKDEDGAPSVNLVGGDRPADVYSSIAKRVHAIMEKDALEDPAISKNAVQARVLLGEVDRKLVKQTVMTSVYGVTFIGARAQIMNRLLERNTLPEGHSVFSASNYAAKVTLSALGEIFTKAKCIMTWLGDCARIIASQNKPVQWRTPLGLPVVQPYRKDGRHIVTTSLQVLSLKRDNDKQVATLRQRTAFPPNFVHSLDGTHMMMTAVACGEAGLVFAGVHDSYWTHAGDVDKMNRILRQKFVDLYSQPILENLLLDFKAEFPGLEFPDVPQRGDLDLKDVLKSTYFFN